MNLKDYGLTPTFPPVLDATMVKDFMFCPSYFYLRRVLGLVKKKYDLIEDAGRDWGSMWHKLLETYNGSIANGMSVAEATDAALVHLSPWPNSLVGETDRHGRTQMRMAEIFFNYIETFGVQDLKVYTPVAAEHFFDTFDEEFGIRWAGRIDRVVRKGQKIILWDYKTTAWMTKYYFEQHEFSFQIPGYVRAVAGMLTEPVNDVIVDVLYTLKNKHEFFRRSIPISPQRLTEWGTNVRNILNYMYYLRDNHLEEPEAWVKNWNHCTMWNRACTFADIHWIDPQPTTRLRILAEDYIVDRWDPSREAEEE